MAERTDERWTGSVDEQARPAGWSDAVLRLVVYASFFLTGATALTFEVLWSRQFVPVFGASTYAVTAVLCAFMAGLGLGGWLGGRLADRVRARLLAYGIVEGIVGLCALGLPVALAVLRRWGPQVALLGSENAAVAMLSRFVLSFALLFLPCGLMGATLPLLSRFCIESRAVVGARVGLLYGVNTLGAMLGCFAAGYWLLDTLGVSAVNRLAAALSGLVGLVCIGLGARDARRRGRAPGPQVQPKRDTPAAEGTGEGERVRGALLLGVALLSGLGGLACEVLWVRYLLPVSNVAYTFPTVLGMYLLGMGVGSLVYRVLLARARRPAAVLAGVMLLLGPAVAGCFAAGALLSATRLPGPLPLVPMAAITVILPTVMMGMAFPLLCSAYVPSPGTAGRRVGALYALNTAGSVAGSLLPAFALIPLLGIQWSILLVSLLYSLVGLTLWVASAGMGGSSRRVVLAAGAAGAVIGIGILLPPDLCQRVALPTGPEMRRHRRIVYYREGRTSTEVILKDVVTGLKYMFMNGAVEVTTADPEMVSFKLMGALGPLLHPEPRDVLMICFGGGISSGVAAQYAEVHSVTAVDLEAGVVRGAGALSQANNRIVDDPKFQFVADDGRNFVLMSDRKWPIVVSDSLHPKSSDAWVLYTLEFYQTVRNALSRDGIFIQWVPFQRLSVAEFKSIVRTFQAVFPHASLWFCHGISKTGLYGSHTLLVGTPERLRIDLGRLSRRLAEPRVAADMRPWALATPVDLLETFVCGEDRLREWAGDGPLNTDDLPYVQYETKYSLGPECTAAVFAPLLESVWPYLYNTGSAGQARSLQAELQEHVRANALMLTGRFKEAIALLPRDPKFRKYAANLSFGRRWVREVAAYYADNARALIWLAGRAMALPDNWEDAVALYRRAVALEPNNAVAHSNLGFALASAGRLDAAIAEYLSALRIDPRLAAAHNNLAVALEAQGRDDEALEHWTRALELDPRLASAHRNVGLILLNRGRIREATAHLSAALRLAPGDPVALRALESARGQLRSQGPDD